MYQAVLLESNINIWCLTNNLMTVAYFSHIYLLLAHHMAIAVSEVLEQEQRVESQPLCLSSA